MRDILLAVAIFCNGAKGISALRLSRNLDVEYRATFGLPISPTDRVDRRLAQHQTG